MCQLLQNVHRNCHYSLLVNKNDSNYTVFCTCGNVSYQHHKWSTARLYNILPVLCMDHNGIYTFTADYIFSNRALMLLLTNFVRFLEFKFLHTFDSTFLCHLELLDLCSPIYLLMLFVFTCIIIEHYSHKMIIQKLWKPFNILISKTNHKQVGNDSDVHAFATVILLSSATTVNIYSKETSIFC